MSHWAELIKETRTAAGLTQAQLASRAKTSQPTIAAYESGDKVPTAATLERLLRVTGVTLATSRAGRRVARRRSLRDQRAEIKRIAAKHHATNVRVFGSVARGEESLGSDIDFLVDTRTGFSLLDHVRLRRELSELLGAEVDVVTTKGLLARDRRTILKDAVPV